MFVCLFSRQLLHDVTKLFIMSCQLFCHASCQSLLFLSIISGNELLRRSK